MKNLRQIKDLIKNMAKEKDINAQILLRNYMLERLLERISLSEFKDNFILKGGMLAAALVGVDMRATVDMDATIKSYPVSLETIQDVLDSILSVEIDDGVDIKLIKIDITTGDKITPKEVVYTFDLLLEDRSIEILAYNIETVVAEKLETLIARGVAKDATHVQVNVTDDMKTVITLGTDIGATDKAGNLLNPNPATITITKGAKDGVRPEVAAVTPLGLDKFEIKFTEELANLAVTDIDVDGTALSATNGTNGAILEQDKNDKTKYTVTLEGTAKVTAGLHKVEIAEDKVSDLSGEGIKAFSQLVNFKADTVAPKFVSSK